VTDCFDRQWCGRLRWHKDLSLWSQCAALDEEVQQEHRAHVLENAALQRQIIACCQHHALLPELVHSKTAQKAHFASCWKWQPNQFARDAPCQINTTNAQWPKTSL